MGAQCGARGSALLPYNCQWIWQIRHRPAIDPALADADDGPIVLAGQLRVPGRRRTARHQHVRGQLLGAHHGLLRIEAGDLHWLLPAGHVARIPPLLPHAPVGADAFDGWSLYVRADAGLDLPPLPRIFQPDVLLQAAVTRALRWPHQALDAAQARLAGVIADEIRASIPCHLPCHNRRIDGCGGSRRRWHGRRTTFAASKRGQPPADCPAAVSPAVGRPKLA